MIGTETSKKQRWKKKQKWKPKFNCKPFKIFFSERLMTVEIVSVPHPMDKFGKVFHCFKTARITKAAFKLK